MKLDSQSSRVVSNQDGVHKDLSSILLKYQSSDYKAPIPDEIRALFDAFDLQNQTRPLVFDTGCGTGKSTQYLAQKYPEALVLGFDTSTHRLDKYQGKKYDNMHFIACDLFAFLHLCALYSVQIEMVCCFYPNPWPKAAHLKRRVHAHPVFSLVFPFVRHWWLRTNWDIYAHEFAHAIGFLSGTQNISVTHNLRDTQGDLTLFEKKYKASGHDLYEVFV